jgi:GNAT superfamily N-acetyltransferase
MAQWLTTWVWEDGDNEARRRARSARRKTILIFDGDEDGRLVGFAAWRMREGQEIDGELVPLGEVRYMGVVPDRQREGIGHQLLANALQIMFHEHGSGDLLISIEVDTGNADARSAYEAWGFEHYRHYESAGHPYETLLLRPEPEENASAEAESESGSEPSSPEA